MTEALKHHGAVVPMITPLTESGELDEAAVDRLVESLIAGGVEGIFILGTTGEGTRVPKKFHRQFVERVAKKNRGRCLLYAGLGDLSPGQFDGANQFFHAGADAVVAHPPISAPVSASELAGWYRALLDHLDGELILYNFPTTTRVSIPLDAIEQLLGHPKLAGIKDSENNAKRHEELLRRFGGLKDFAIFIGVGALMEKGLKLGASGVVPSVGNLIPDVCKNLCASALRGDWAAAENDFLRMTAVSALYQKGRTLDESLALLKAALHCRGFCEPHVLPPLRPVSGTELILLRTEMSRLHLLNGK